MTPGTKQQPLSAPAAGTRCLVLPVEYQLAHEPESSGHMVPTPSPPQILCYYAPHHQEALELEVSVLGALLRRNRCSQRRTRHHQRLSQALRFVAQSSRLLRLWDNATALLCDATHQAEALRSRQERRQLFWELLPSGSSGGATPASSERDEPDGSVDDDGLSPRLESLIGTLTRELPEAVSRLQYAADLLWKEIARGFYLPYCTVALAATARLRILLLALVGHVSQVLVPQLPGLCRKLDPPAPSTSPPLWREEWDPALRDLRIYLESQVTEAPHQHNPQTAAQKKPPPLERSLRALSLPPSARGRQATSVAGSTAAPSDAASDDSGPGEAEPEDAESGVLDAEGTPASGRDTTPEDDDVDHDVGESVAAAPRRHSGAEAASRPYDGIDRNLAIVEQLRDRPVSLNRKDKKEEKKWKKKSKEPKEGNDRKKRPSSSDRASSDELKPSKRPKKNKKKKDFFDDLFAS